MTVVPQLGDIDVFDNIALDDLWCVDKLILSKKLDPTNIYVKVEKYGGGGISHLGYFRLENAGVDIHTEG